MCWACFSPAQLRLCIIDCSKLVVCLSECSVCHGFFCNMFASVQLFWPPANSQHPATTRAATTATVAVARGHLLLRPSSTPIVRGCCHAMSNILEDGWSNVLEDDVMSTVGDDFGFEANCCGQGLDAPPPQGQQQTKAAVELSELACAICETNPRAKRQTYCDSPCGADVTVALKDS